MIQRRSLAAGIALIGFVGSSRFVAAQPVDASFSVYTGLATRPPTPEDYVPAQDIMAALPADSVDAEEIALLRSWIPNMTIGEEISVRLVSHSSHNGTPGMIRVRRVK